MTRFYDQIMQAIQQHVNFDGLYLYLLLVVMMYNCMRDDDNDGDT